MSEKDKLIKEQHAIIDKQKILIDDCLKLIKKQEGQIADLIERFITKEGKDE